MGLSHRALQIAARARSFLFVPALRPERFEKALSSGADAVILDLEDSVAERDKERARDLIAAHWSGLSDPARCLIRINGAHTGQYAEDLALCLRLGVAAVVVPKVEGRGDLGSDIDTLQAVAWLPLVESARGWLAVSEIAAAPGVVRLIFGSLDFQLDLAIEAGPEETELAPVRLSLAAASRVAGLASPVDGICVATNDQDRVRDDARRARRLGFGAKLCIHPNQIAPVHEAFEPTADEISWAQRVLGAAESSGAGATQLDGQMIDRPVMVRAEQILARAKYRSPGA